MGSFALGNNQASGITAIGAEALSGNTDGIRNTAAGTAALLQNDTPPKTLPSAITRSLIMTHRNGTANRNTALALRRFS